MPEISVIIPVYNTEKYLKRCIEGLINQTFSDIEFVFIDDGSTDKSLSILKEYAAKDERIRVYHKENGGQATARNMGIGLSRGRYIGFADSDDYVDHSLYEKLYASVSDISADYAECRFVYLEEKEEEYKELPARGRIRQYTGNKDMFFDPQVSPWNKLYKREVIVDNGILFPEGLIYEDTSFYIKCIPYIERMSYVSERLVYYFLRAGSTINSNKNIKVLDIIPVLQDAIDFYRERNLTETYGEELEYFCSKIILCSSLGRIGRIKDKKTRRKLYSDSFAFLKEQFPCYLNNRYLKGKIGLYMKIVRRWNCGLFGFCIGRIQKG